MLLLNKFIFIFCKRKIQALISLALFSKFLLKSIKLFGSICFLQRGHSFLCCIHYSMHCEWKQCLMSQHKGVTNVSSSNSPKQMEHSFVVLLSSSLFSKKSLNVAKLTLLRFFITFCFKLVCSRLFYIWLNTEYEMQGQKRIINEPMQRTIKAEGKIRTIITQKVSKPKDGYGS